jgi:hypothetical protein
MSIHVTSRRRREIGIRKTLGATAPRVVLMLLRDFFAARRDRERDRLAAGLPRGPGVP